MSENQVYNASVQSSKSWVATLLLFIFLGGFSAHRFYVGKVGTAILQILTLGGLGIWYLIDFIMILTSNFTDSNGNKIRA